MTTEYYPFASSDDERQRLIAQGELVAPLTRRLFEKAGIAAGMRVLDIGSGSGDVALLAARLVGPAGSVIGVDSDPAQVAFAAQRAKAEGHGNVRFMAADFRAITLDRAVDAIVGRLVLMYAADPVDALRLALRNLKAGGVIALQESIIDYDGPVLIEPPDCLAAKAVEWFRAGFRHAGVQPRMGMRLFGVMRAAGLDPSPDIDMLVPIQQGPDGALFRILTAVVRSQIPAIVASGAATQAEIDIDTLEQRLIADAPPGGVVGYFNAGHVGVWARKPEA
jgi:ubiquinone/menaquinone biosynthesis C-methylase UbiE